MPIILFPRIAIYLFIEIFFIILYYQKVNYKIKLLGPTATLVAIAAPILFVIANILAIYNPSLARFFPTPSYVCQHIDCLFLLETHTLYQLSLIVVCGVLSCVYLIFFIFQLFRTTNPNERIPLIMIGIAHYCTFIQIIRIPLAFFVFQNYPRWWTLSISQVTLCAFTLHASIFFVHSISKTIKRKINTPLWGVGAIAAALCITFLIPIDRHFLTNQLIHKIGYFTQLQILFITVHVTILVDHTKHYIETRKGADLLLQIGHLLHALAMYALFAANTNDILVLVAIVTFPITTIIFIRRTALHARIRK